MAVCFSTLARSAISSGESSGCAASDASGQNIPRASAGISKDGQEVIWGTTHMRNIISVRDLFVYDRKHTNVYEITMVLLNSENAFPVSCAGGVSSDDQPSPNQNPDDERADAKGLELS